MGGRREYCAGYRPKRCVGCRRRGARSSRGWRGSRPLRPPPRRERRDAGAGPRAHLFYAGDVADANFKNFVLRAQVKTFPKANSGIYFHTKYQAKGWPNAGFEAQVNNTHGDPKKTGGLYAVKDVNPAPAKDGEWFNYEIRVKGKKITIKINGKVTSSWTEVPNAPHLKSMPGRKLGSGTFALQAHDPQSVVHYRNIRVKPLK